MTLLLAPSNFLKQLEGASDRLTLVKADLLEDEETWRGVVRGCEIVLHTASPFVVENVPKGKEEEFFMVPAVQGTKIVLKACIAENVRRVVLTSSVAAISGGHEQSGASDPCAAPPGADETVWTNIEGLTLPSGMYVKSKTVAEKTAWELVQGTAVELAVVNPVLVLGPFLSMDTSSGSVVVLRALLKREYPMVPFHCCDVRDVAKMHLKAALSPTAGGKRFLCCSTPVSVPMPEIARVLDAAGFDVPTGVMPNWLLRGVALFDKKVKMVLPSLGKTSYLNPKNGNELIEEQWIDYQTSLREMALSMMNLAGIGKLKKKP